MYISDVNVYCSQFLHVLAFQNAIIRLYEKAEVCSMLWTVEGNILNVVVTGGVSVYLSVRPSHWNLSPKINISCTTYEEENRNFEQ
jgi:hypothetical protein